MKNPWPKEVQEKMRECVAHYGNFKCRLLGDINRDELNEDEYKSVAKNVLRPLLINATSCEVVFSNDKISEFESMSSFLRRKGRKIIVDPKSDLNANAAFWRPKDRSAGDVIFSVRPDWDGWASLYRSLWDPVAVRNPGAALDRSALRRIKASIQAKGGVFLCLPAVNMRTMLFTFAEKEQLHELFRQATTSGKYWVG